MHSKSQLRRPNVVRSTLATLLLSVVASLSWSAAAHAGDYDVYYCKFPNGNKAGTMSFFNASHNGYGTDNCASTSYELGLGSGMHRSTEYAAATIDAAPDTKIVSVSAIRAGAIIDPATGDTNASPQFSSVYGTPSTRTGDGCSWWDTSPVTGTTPCRGIGWAPYTGGSSVWYQDYSKLKAGGTDTFSFVVSCSGAGTCDSSDNGDTRVAQRIFQVGVMVSDTSAPAFTGNFSGDATDPAPLKGTRTISADVTDKGSGIYQSALVIDGTVVQTSGIAATNWPSCKDQDAVNRLQFDRMQPCPLSTTVTQSIDTTKLTEGSHKMSVLAYDAAGNSSEVYYREFKVDNLPPPSANIKPSIVGATPTGGLRPGDVLVASDGAWTGSGIVFAHRWQRLNEPTGAWIDIPNAVSAKYTVTTDDVEHSLRLQVTATNSQGTATEVTEGTAAVRSGATVQTQSLAPSASTPVPVPAATPAPASADAGNGSGGDTASGQLVLDREQKSIDVKYGTKIVITGRLVDANNEPIADADVDVFEQLVTTTASWKKIGTIRTDAQGGYLFRPNTLASRRLRFAWSNKIGTADYRATREVLVSVTAGMSITTAHRVVSRHATIKLSGRVAVAGLPATGQWVEIQVLDAGVWRTVATRKLSSKGGWSFKHRLTSSKRITFAFRSRLRQSGEIPAVESKSTPVKVHVR